MSWRSERVAIARSRGFQRPWRQDNAVETTSRTSDRIGMGSPHESVLETDMANLAITNISTTPEVAEGDLRMENAILHSRLGQMEKQHQKDFEDQRKNFEISGALRESRIKRLERQLEHQSESHQDAEEIIQVLREDLDAAKTELELLKIAHADNVASIQQDLDELEGVVRQLTADKIDLEKRAKTVQPLVLIGVAIRRRFIEKAARKAYSWSPRDGEHLPAEHLICEGNDAAHQPNVQADLALYQFDDHSGAERERDVKIIEAIYGWGLIQMWTGSFSIIPLEIQAREETFNSVATIRTLLSKNESILYQYDRGLGPHLTQLLEMHEEHIDFLNDRADALHEAGYADNWDEAYEMLDDDEIVQERLAEIKGLLDKVVELLGGRPGA